MKLWGKKWGTPYSEGSQLDVKQSERISSSASYPLVFLCTGEDCMQQKSSDTLRGGGLTRETAFKSVRNQVNFFR